MSEVGTPPPVEPSDIQRQRAHINQLETDLKAKEADRLALEEQLKAHEREKLAELDRVKLEKDELAGKVKELEPLKAKIEANDSFFKSMFDKELATLPAEIQENALKLTGNASSESARLEMLTLFKASIPAPATPPTRPVGTPTGAPLPGSVPVISSPPPAVAPKDWGAPEGGFIGLVKAAAVPAGSQATGVKE